MTLQDQAKIAEMMCRNLLDQAIGAGIVHLNDDDMADAQELTDNNVYHMANLLRTYLGDVERLLHSIGWEGKPQ